VVGLFFQNSMEGHLEEEGAEPDEDKAPQGSQIDGGGGEGLGKPFGPIEEKEEGCSEFQEHERGHDPAGPDGMGLFISGESLLWNLGEKGVMNDLNKPDDAGHH